MEWNLYSLELDGGAEEMGSYFMKSAYGIKRVKPEEASRGASLTYIAKSDAERITGKLIKGGERNLVLYGDGNYHHFTYGLCRIADELSKEYCYIHIDHHNDMFGDTSTHSISCGNFVGQILTDCNVRSGNRYNMLFIGSMPYESKMSRFALTMDNVFMEDEIMRFGMKRLEFVLGNMPRDVYVTMDLDVMAESEIYTEYQSPRGLMKKRLLDIIDIIKTKKKIIGADVLGYTHRNQKKNDVGILKRWKSRRLYKAIVDRLMEA